MMLASKEEEILDASTILSIVISIVSIIISAIFAITGFILEEIDKLGLKASNQKHRVTCKFQVDHVPFKVVEKCLKCWLILL